jgi:DNA polymerase-1
MLNIYIESKDYNDTFKEYIDEITEGINYKIVEFNKKQYNILIKDSNKHILCIGNEAFKKVFEGVQISFTTSMYEKFIPDIRYNRYVLTIPTLDCIPKAGKKREWVVIKELKNKIIKYIKHNKSIYDFSKHENEITLLFDISEVTKILRDMLDQDPEYIIMDYETNALHPWISPKTKVLCLSIGTSLDNIYVLHHTVFTPENIKLLRLLLQNKNIKKVAHNNKFEHLWTKHQYKFGVMNWFWDTMEAQHIINNEPKTCDLKFQAFVRYGIPDYDSELHKEKTTIDKDGLNLLESVDPVKLMTYCGKDVLYTIKIFEDQQDELLSEQYQCLKLLMEGDIALSEIETEGIGVDIEKLNKNKEYCLQVKDGIMKNIRLQKEVIAWEKKNGEINLNSPTQLKDLFFTDMKLITDIKTKKGSNSTNAESLKSLHNTLADLLLEYRKYDKIEGTFLSNILECSTNGKIHPQFPLHFVRTYRSSSLSPNFQNIPVHDVIAQKLIRECIKPSPGRYFMEVDYSGIEVVISACYHKDPTMLKYINDESTNMHTDMGAEIFLYPKDKLPKELRSNTKSNFVFPEFYGDWYESCANNLWNNLTTEVIQHLKDSGIADYKEFVEHIKKIEEDFWNVRFPVYKQWKEKTINFYYSHGYITNLLNFRYKGHMRRNELLNYPIQGVAFLACLLWSLIQIHKELKRLKMKSRICGQVHDSILFDVEPCESAQLKDIVQRIMCEETRKQWKFIIVPLKIEMTRYKLNGNWCEKDEKVS